MVDLEILKERKSGTQKPSKNKEIDNKIYKMSEPDQNKHIKGSKYYQKGKSIFLGTIQDAQELINRFKGKGEKINDNKERVNFGKIIGQYVDSEGNKYDTTIGIIHTSDKKGSHIVPARPKEVNNNDSSRKR